MSDKCFISCCQQTCIGHYYVPGICTYIRPPHLILTATCEVLADTVCKMERTAEWLQLKA